MAEAEIPILEGEPGWRYEPLGEVRVKVGARTAFSKAPTTEAADAKLRKAALKLQADAVVLVTYERGVSMSSWKSLTATGQAVRIAGRG